MYTVYIIIFYIYMIICTVTFSTQKFAVIDPVSVFLFLNWFGVVVS